MCFAEREVDSSEHVQSGMPCRLWAPPLWQAEVSSRPYPPDPPTSPPLTPSLRLHRYATADPLALLARLGICASIIFSYPLNFVGLRDGVLGLFKLDGSKNSVHTIATLMLLCGMNGIALVLKNLGLVVAVGGAALGTSLVYTFPAMMFIQVGTRMDPHTLPYGPPP